MAREAYVRYTYRIVGWEVTVGLEFRRGDSLDGLRAALKFRIAKQVALLAVQDPDAGDDAVAEALEGVLMLRWPDRAYFIEVGPPDDSWIQVYDPKNFVKERCTCACAT